MAKGSSSRWVVFLLALVLLGTTALVTGLTVEDRGSGKVFPPKEGEEEEERGGGRGGSGRGSGGSDSRGRGGDDESGRGKVFPPEGDDETGKGKVSPPEEEPGRGERPEEDYGRGGGGTGHGGGGRRGWTETRRFILSDSKRVVATAAGGMKVVRGVGGKLTESPMHIGFITMEPNSMFIPQYLDSSLILFIHRGEVRIGSIYDDDLVEKDLKAGDLYRIQAGSVFYLVNIAEGQRLHIIVSIDTAESIDFNVFEAFSIAGGTRSVLFGFDIQTLATALNVSLETVIELQSSRHDEGEIVFLNPDSGSGGQPSMWTRFLKQEPRARKTQMMQFANVGRKTNKDSEMSPWSFRNLFVGLLGKYADNSDKSLDSYNIYNQEADFRNDYGWSIEVTGDDYEPLRSSDFGVYLVNLTAGSMMAPHINPTAIEYGIVLSGTGNIQVVFPNGTSAMDAQVSEGDVFWIPRYFPFCQVASRSGPFVFFGFSTSARSNNPQFLAGKGSILKLMLGPGVAASFGLSEERMKEIVDAQNQTTILPSTAASPGGGAGEIPQGEGEGDPAGPGQGPLLMEKVGSKIRMGMKKNRFAYDMAMGMN